MFGQIGKPLIMGILNCTPDSFSDGGLYDRPDAALEQVGRMLAEGADIIDVGGESTRPGADSVTADDQIERVVPIINAVKARYQDTVISIDTTLAKVAAAAVDAGATIINDVSGGADDPALLSVAAKRQTGLILMHRQGTPKTMQDNPSYRNVVAEVKAGLRASVQKALRAGVPAPHIAVDPGIGFGKRKQDNLDLLAHLPELTALNWPVLLGASRKRFMGAVCAVERPSELVTATAVTTALGVMAGVKIFRVHDVKENRQALEVAWAIKERLDA